MTRRVEIVEVGPRDGLQNEAQLIPTDQKIALVDLLSLAGFRRIEVASFVSPKRVPQMADGAEVLTGLARQAGVSYGALTPNLSGFERAVAAGADEVAVFASASEGFSRANVNASIADSFARFASVTKAAQRLEVPVRGYISCVISCPYDGATTPAQVARVAAQLLGMGCYEISLGDTIGQGSAETVEAMLNAVLQEVPASRLAGHFHDTGGQALENIDVALAAGLRVFDASVAGLGGCPFAPGAPGNVATESVAQMVNSRGYDCGLNIAAVQRAARFARHLREAGEAAKRPL